MLLLLPLATLLLGGGTVLSAVSSGPPGSDRWLSSLSETDGYWGKFRDVGSPDAPSHPPCRSSSIGRVERRLLFIFP
ncbi:unnamed protein product [Arctogadus glacialis]